MTSLRGKRPVVGLVGTVDVIEKMVSEGQEVVASPMKNDAKGLTDSRLGGKVGSGRRVVETRTVRGDAGTADRVCAIRSI